MSESPVCKSDPLSVLGEVTKKLKIRCCQLKAGESGTAKSDKLASKKISSKFDLGAVFSESTRGLLTEVKTDSSPCLSADTLDTIDLSLLDTFSFKSGNPGKWPSWKDLDIGSRKPGNPTNRGEVIKAIHDLCSSVELILDRLVAEKSLETEAISNYRAEVISVRKKISVLEDFLSPTDPWPLLTALEETYTRFACVDSETPEVSILDGFAFCSGKPGLFATWTDLDMRSREKSEPSNRGAVIAAVRDLISKSEQMLARPSCQSALGISGLEKYRPMIMSVSEKLTLLGEALSPQNVQPLLSMVEEVGRRFEHVASDGPDLSILDSFAFHPGKPGLFTTWTDLDVTTTTIGSANNRGSVIMALDDLMAKIDGMLDRRACQKMLGMATVHKYRLMRSFIGEKLDLFKNAILPTHLQAAPRGSSVGSTTLFHSAISTPFVSSPSFQPCQEQEKIDAIKIRIGAKAPIVRPILFSREGCMEAGAMAGSSMMVAMCISIAFHSFLRAIPLVGLMALVFSLVRRQHIVAVAAKRCAVAKDLYKNAASNKDIVPIFSMLTRSAQAHFLVGLDSEFRENIARRYASLKNMCALIDAFLLSCPESLERANALATFPKEGLGEEIISALTKERTW